ncbi:hypothetical protein BDV38DRAFT_276690 [Aspergillus pseudotamarii]|uniref:Uncharacterized protein n=1 Tax=Aspergillus pseudotamarii TaxID=132259 RepID=A0A5N6TBG5_ASPPS|nr:uncharacterized protein BDV38DRAFT_276690 [Aspergillus pseudotamarii]KAE8143607.1 hypothetical protein BDV38DRAFT_276690 [Aspergillus pseudotamarii]
MVSLALTDSPVGFAAWLWDLKNTGSDGYPYSYEEIITDTMLSWIQSPYGSIQDYHLVYTAALSFPKSDMPTGVTQWGNIHGPFPALAKFNLAPLDWIERTTHVVYFK